VPASTRPVSRGIARHASSFPLDLDDVFQLPDLLAKSVEEMKDYVGQVLIDQGIVEVEFPEKAISSLGMAEDGIPANGILETMSIRAISGAEKVMAAKVTKLVEQSDQDPLVMTATATQNKDDPNDFMVLIRYESMQHMQDHQTAEPFKKALQAMESQLDRPIGLYLVDEQGGEVGMARHPFGPGGEGGRDDAIYSSRANRGGVGR